MGGRRNHGRQLIQRRDLIALIGGAVVAGRGVVRAAASVPRIAFVAVGFGADTTAFDAIRDGLRGLGDVEGQAFVAEPYVSDDAALIPRLAEQVVAAHPAVIVTINALAVPSLLKLTQTLPIVVAFCADPVSLGLSKSVARPSGNVTGILNLEDTLLSKRIELLGQIVGPMKRVGLLYEVGYAGHAIVLAKAKALGATAGPRIVPLGVRSPAEVATALERDEAQKLEGLVVSASPMIVTQETNLIVAATAHRLPTVHLFAFEVQNGALASYGAEPAENFQRAAEYTDRVLRGAKVSDLPFEAPRTFHLALNLRTAKALGLTIPPTLLAQADEVIE